MIKWVMLPYELLGFAGLLILLKSSLGFYALAVTLVAFDYPHPILQYLIS